MILFLADLCCWSLLVINLAKNSPCRVDCSTVWGASIVHKAAAAFIYIIVNCMNQWSINLFYPDCPDQSAPPTNRPKQRGAVLLKRHISDDVFFVAVVGWLLSCGGQPTSSPSFLVLLRLGYVDGTCGRARGWMVCSSNASSRPSSVPLWCVLNCPISHKSTQWSWLLGIINFNFCGSDPLVNVL